MCGITGYFGDNSKDQVVEALKIMKNRGKDASNTIHLNNFTFGHNLHAIINHSPQPLRGKGILVANCEIYNWKELAQKYNLNPKNDAELLLEFLDKFNLTKIDELDGVYAFAYYKDKTLYLARDILGVKPLFYAISKKHFSFASEGKALEHTSVELNPRKILIYKDNQIKFEQRKFFDYLPTHKEDYDEVFKQTKKLLETAIKKRIPPKKFGLLFSGGIDSTYLALIFKKYNLDFTCYTAALDTEQTQPKDLVWAKKVAKELDLKLKIKTIKIENIPPYLQKILPLIEDSNVVKVGVALTFYLACELAKKDGCKVIFSGLGSEEIFAGYERHKLAKNINQECLSGLRKIYERDLYRDDVLTMDLGLELRVPFLDKKLVSHALKIPVEYKIKNEKTKWILRQIALKENLPEDIANRKKTAAQYGSKFDYALIKLAKKNKTNRSTYLRQFYNNPNVKLGVLFSSGKDSTYAAYIMQKQNYELSCLLTIKSENPDSYMFHTPAINLAKIQAESMKIPIIFQTTKGEKEIELKDLKKLIQKGIEEYQIAGVVTGAVLSTYQRDRIERICEELGIKVFSPLWNIDPQKEMEELIKNRFKVVLTAVAGDGFSKKWLGQEITTKTLEELNQLQQKYQISVNGEGGEYESLVLDCPLFKKKLKLINFQKEMDSPISGRLIVNKVELIEK